MMFVVRIDPDNFPADELATEIGKVLRRVARQIQAGRLPPFSIMDNNGNTVAWFEEQRRKVGADGAGRRA